MARPDPDLTVSQALLDRLINTDPGLATDPPVTRAQSIRLLKQSLRRDLEWLLNTRRIPEAAGEEYPELSRSLFNYGLPDFTTLSVSSSRDRAKLLKEVEAVVAIFEPRLRDVNVKVLEIPDSKVRALTFQIEGMLQMDPAPEHISFDTTLSLTSGEYLVKGDRSA
ncbi:MAG: type VI secretion system baseplate subunit TssE [Bryobacteraceae bacterium]|nr:type VI secretion system baseplate subunit TssE [Bryobacteraceae bacterium]